MSEPHLSRGGSVQTRHPCLHCVHFIEHWKCKAFPTMIPHDIRNGKHDHKEPYPGDRGIQYEPDETARRLEVLYSEMKEREGGLRPKPSGRGGGRQRPDGLLGR